MASLAAVVTVGTQIPYPLASGSTQRVLTIVSVVAFFAASLLHAADTRGLRAATLLVGVCVGGGLMAEAMGSRTGFPFGNYRYNDSLGATVAGVPVVVGLAWAMMGWPALLCGRRVADRFRCSHRSGAVLLTAFVGSLVLVTWDLFLDPQMVEAGHWSWLATPGPWLHGVPLVNSLGWFATGVLMMILLEVLVPTVARAGSSDALAWALVGWTWFSEWFGHLVFFGRPTVGIVGGLAMTPVLMVVAKPDLLRSRT